MNNIHILKEYQDRVYVYNVLCVKTYEYYNQLKSVINIPLILSSSVMTILNSGSFEPEQLQIPNLIVNACTTIMISLINNFKIAEKSQVFRNLSLKYITLLHEIEHKVNNDNNIDADEIQSIVKQYDDLLSMNEYTFPEHIKRKVKKIFSGKRILPVIISDNESQPSPPSSKQHSASATENFIL